MTTLNRYIKNQHAYIEKKRLQPLTGFTNQIGEQASWEDIAVTFTNGSGKTVNFLFNNGNQPRAKFVTTFTEADKLDPESHQLLFAYCLDLINENTNLITKRIKIGIAKKFLIRLGSNVACSSMNDIQHTVDSIGNTQLLSSFFDWLHLHKMLSASCCPLFIRSSETRGKSGDEAIEEESKKLPDEKALLALGAIFYDVIPPYKNKPSDISGWKDLIHPSKIQRDAFTCTMSALAMSSPSRAAAEQAILTKQRLQSHTETVEGKPETVYYLNWRGSKGYLDNQKHFNTEMAESLDRALHYMGIVTEPARVLARFYNAPNRPLKDVLGEFKPQKVNLNLLNPAKDKPITLIHLALLLGFYDGTDKMARVTPDTQGAVEVPNPKNKQQPRFLKPIAELTPFDKLLMVIECPYVTALFGQCLFRKRDFKKYSAGKAEPTVSELQNHFVDINQAKLKGYNETQNKRVDYENSLFAFTERQIFQRGASHFLLISVAALGHYFYNDLKKNNRSQKSIFERHGFSADIFVKPHQFRHWQNDYLDKKGLPHAFITMLSGRKSPEQTLTYIHTTDAQNASVISDILYDQETEEEAEEQISKRIQSKTQYDAAIDNLAPTFVTEVGFCTQNLTLSPCTYMTEFETQCTLCPSSCHVAHDEKAIELLKKDLKVQTHNLEQVQETINFTSSDGMQQWYKTHFQNTCMLKNLVGILADKSIKEGSIVRYIASSNALRITDLDTKAVTERTLNLPDPTEALQAAIEAKTSPDNTAAKNNFLDFLGSM